MALSCPIVAIAMKRFFLLFALISFLSACGGGGGGSTPSAPDPTPEPSQSTAPTVANANTDQTAVAGVPFSYDVTQGGTTFSGDSFTISVTLSEPSLGLSVENGVISGTPQGSGTVTVMITADDGNGGTVTDEFLLVISAPQVAAQPNILFIMSDDQGQDSSAQYALSTDLPVTPNLDSLAANGLVFDNIWVNPACTPTRAALLSGRHGVRTGVLSVGDTLPASEIPLHAFLANDPVASSYATALFGKWHLGGGQTGPNDIGIPHFAGIVGGGVNNYFNWTLNVNGVNTNTTNYVTTELTDQALEWISAQTQPWFVWLAYNAPHTPFHLPPADLHTQNLSGNAADIAANERDYYLAAIEAMDTEIGRLLETLPAEQRDNTIIIFVGDNGTPAQVRDVSVFPNGAKGSLTEGGVKVPMIVSGVGVTRQGERESSLINSTDFFATIADLAGSATTEINDSRSFRSVLSSATAPGRDYIYSEIVGNTSGWTIRNSQYKLTVLNNGAESLYDVVNDPMENTNLLNTGTDVAEVRNDLFAAGSALRQ